MNNMRIFTLLIFLLSTGFMESSVKKECKQGRVEFTCKYPNKKKPKSAIIIQSTQNNEGGKGAILYHETLNHIFRVVIIQSDSKSKFKCPFYSGAKEPKSEAESCQEQLNQSKPQATTTCDLGEPNSNVMFCCKEKNFASENIFSTRLSAKSNRTFTLKHTDKDFKISISHVPSQDNVVHRCGVKSNAADNTAPLKKIQLEIHNIPYFTKTLTVGQNLSYWCKYTNDAFPTKFICKEEDPICPELMSTDVTINKRFSMEDDKKRTNITVRLGEVKAGDTGTYWCGAKSNNSRIFFNKLVMTVVPPTLSTSTRSSALSTSTQSTTSSVSHAQSDSTEQQSNSQFVTIVSVCVSVMLLQLFVFIVVLSYKRCSHSKDTRNASTEQQIREDYIYDEIQERFQKTESGNTAITVYATANFPTNQSDSMHYSTVKFQKGSHKTGGEALVPKHSSSACEYATVKYTASPTYSVNVSQSSSSKEPLYSTVTRAK